MTAETNVVTIKPRLPGAKSMMLVERAPICEMHAFVVDEKNRTIQCRLCSSVLDPFDAMAYVARRWPDYGGHRTALRIEIATLAADRDRLDREVVDLEHKLHDLRLRTSVLGAPRDISSARSAAPRRGGSK